ncbi:hypothetical protein [Hymenobacter sp. BT491]|uniref:hypothetical protein n=1 Tax=Hymenobacter sp. BT491 TaxID=2766779 RepID=UPI001653B44D|nr:hypothetical protein [Hymenobacter sp. BT491]MBC6991735.1 hypothetical protein [Hymenobacter sp. BT491]
MLIRFISTAAFLLTASLTAQAQLASDPARFAQGYAALQHDAAAVRNHIDSLSTAFTASPKLSKRSTNKLRSYVLNGASQKVRAKEYFSKIFRRGGEVTLVRYYDPVGRLVLAERYNNGQLIRLELNEYNRWALRPNKPYRTSLFVRGDYISRVIKQAPPAGNATETRPVKQYFYKNIYQQ